MSMPLRRIPLAFTASFALLAMPLAGQSGAGVGKTSVRDALTQKEARRREAVEHYLRAKLYAQESEFEAAVREFKKAVELDPADGALRREYGELLRDLPVYAEAEKEARKAVELEPESAGGHRLLGQVLLSTAKDTPRLQEAAPEVLPGLGVGGVEGHRALDEHVRRAREAPAGAGRNAAIRTSLEAQLLEDLARHGTPMGRDEALGVFAGDLDLNAQGLGVWLDAQPR